MQYPPLTQFGQTNLANSIFVTSQPPLLHRDCTIEAVDDDSNSTSKSILDNYKENFKHGFWLAGSKAASQSEAMLKILKNTMVFNMQIV